MMNHPSIWVVYLYPPLYKIFFIFATFFTTLFGFLIFFRYICMWMKIDGKTVLPLKPIKREVGDNEKSK